MDDEELEQKRAKARVLIDEGHFNTRTCHECNPAHQHFTNDESCVILCFACGKWWLGAVDLTDYRDAD